MKETIKDLANYLFEKFNPNIHVEFSEIINYLS